MSLEIRILQPQRLAYLRYTGPYGSGGIGQTWQRFAAWCRTASALSTHGTMYGIAQDDPSVTPAAQCRYDCCAPVGEAFQPEGDIAIQRFQGGKYACFSFVGTAGEIGGAWAYLYGTLLRENGWQAEARPGVEIYENDFVVDAAAGRFRCELCVPVKPL